MMIPSDGTHTGKYTADASSGVLGTTNLASEDFYDLASAVQGTKLPAGLVFTSITVEATHATQDVYIGIGAKGDRSNSTNMHVIRAGTSATITLRGQLVSGSPVTTICNAGSAGSTTQILTATFTKTGY
jgi:hypothetical protein